MKAALMRWMLIAVVMFLLGACATAAPKVVQPQQRYFWPPAPERPRIEWIAAYQGDLDIREKGGFMAEIIGEDSTVDFGRPVAAAGDGEGHIVITDQELGQVFMFDLNQRKAFPLGGEAELASFTQPTGVTVDGDGVFYIADNTARKVFVVSGQNAIMRVLDLSGHVKSIGSLAIDRSRARLIVPDAKGSKVCIFSLTGQLQSTIDGKGYFSYPNAVAVLSDGGIVVTDTYNSKIVRFTADGKYINSIGKRGDSAGDLAIVTGVAVDSDDNIYTVDARLHSMTIFNKEGGILMVVGGHHSVRSGNIGRGGFQVPQGITIDKNDRIYVADSLNKRVQVFQYVNERYLRQIPGFEPKP